MADANPGIRVLIFNMKAGNEATPPEERRNDIRCIFRDDYDIILAQEILSNNEETKWGLQASAHNFDSYTCMHDQPELPQYLQDDQAENLKSIEAGIMFNKHTMKLINEYGRQWKKETLKNIRKQRHNNFLPQFTYRSYIALFYSITNKTHILAVSWHGKYRKGDAEQKLVWLDELIVMIEHIAKVISEDEILDDLAVIIGSDFNIKSKQVKQYDRFDNDKFGSFRRARYRQSVRRLNNVYDGFLYTEQFLTPKNSTKALTHSEFCGEHDEWQMDHDPITANFNFATHNQQDEIDEEDCYGNSVTNPVQYMRGRPYQEVVDDGDDSEDSSDSDDSEDSSDSDDSEDNEDNNRVI